MNLETAVLIDKLKKGDRRALAKAVSAVENGDPGKEEILDYAFRRQRADSVILGFTGAGGVGKSTLISDLITFFRRRDMTVGVIAVDPSSPFSGGAVLGDRVRMGRHSSDEGVFIRSLGSRGLLGGLSRTAKEALYLFQAHCFDVIMLESLGVGQAEVDINDFVDVSTVILAPGFGDAIQLAKAGLREIADVFLVNKADQPEAEALFAQLTDSLSACPEHKRPLVLKTVASEGRGVAELAEALLDTRQARMALRPEKKKRRVLAEIVSGVRSALDEVAAEAALAMVGPVLEGRMTPFEASRLIWAALKTDGLPKADGPDGLKRRESSSGAVPAALPTGGQRE
jgi:LAO/AO transport system kinase